MFKDWYKKYKLRQKNRQVDKAIDKFIKSVPPFAKFVVRQYIENTLKAHPDITAEVLVSKCRAFIASLETLQIVFSVYIDSGRILGEAVRKGAPPLTKEKFSALTDVYAEAQVDCLKPGGLTPAKAREHCNHITDLAKAFLR